MGFVSRVKNAVVGMKAGWGFDVEQKGNLNTFFNIRHPGVNDANPQNPFKQYTTAQLLQLKQTSATVFSCVGAISQAFQEAPLQVVEKDEEGGVEPVPDHEALIPFLDNPWLSESDIKRMIIENLELTGASFVLKFKNGYGATGELWPLPTSWVTPKPVEGSIVFDNKTQIINHYELTVPGSGNKYNIKVEDMIFMRDIDPGSMWKFVSPCGSSFKALITEEQADAYQIESFRSLKAPGIVVKTPKPLTTRQENDLHRVLEEKLGSNARKNAILVSGEGADLTVLNPLEGMNWELIRDFDEIRICQAFRVPPIVAGCYVGAKNSPWSNTGEAWRSFYEHKMVGRWNQVAQSLTLGLLRQKGEIVPKQFFKFDLTAIKYLQEEYDKLVDRATKLFQGGLITRDRAREIVGEPKLEDETGEQMVQPMNLVPVTAGLSLVNPDESLPPADEELPPAEQQEEPANGVA